MQQGNWATWERLIGGADGVSAAISAGDAYIEGIEEDPAYQEDATVNGETMPIVAAQKSGIRCDIKAIPGNVVWAGDIVNCLDATWLVVESWIDKIGVTNGTMWLCNHVLRFQDGQSDTVYERPCVIDDGSYSISNSQKIISAADGTYKIYISIDEHTKRMFVDKRLGIGTVYAKDGSSSMEVYDIVGMDMKSKNFGAGAHLMVLTMKRGVYNEGTDDAERQICDVYAEDGGVIRPEGSPSCEIVGSSTIRIGAKRKYYARFYDADMNELYSVESDWSISSVQGVSISASGNVCTLEADLNSDLIGSSVTLTLAPRDASFEGCSMEVQVVPVA